MSLTGNILIIDDEVNIREGLKKNLLLDSHQVDTAHDGNEALSKALHVEYDVLICDLQMPNMSGEEFLEQILEIKPYLKIIILTGHGTINNAVFVMKQGAYDFFIKPVDIDKLKFCIQRALKEKKLQEENEHLKAQLSNIAQSYTKYISTQSSSMKEVWSIAKQVAKTDTTILIEGESGTGKEVVAHTVHDLSPRKNHPLIIVNCGALNPNLLESELFGHEKGSFTGAYQEKKGRFELAHQGTIFLDEIGELPLELQVKLLRVIQEKTIERIGSEKSITVDVRIISATNKDLYKEVQKANFREDLYYRLNVVNIKIPPLRERAVDIPLLVNQFIKEYSILHSKNVLTIKEETLLQLEKYLWPGNIRELKNTIERMVVLSKDSILDTSDLPTHIQTMKLNSSFCIPLGLSLEEVEKLYILETLNYNEHNKSKTAKSLQIGRKTLYDKLDWYKIE